MKNLFKLLFGLIIIITSLNVSASNLSHTNSEILDLEEKVEATLNLGDITEKSSTEINEEIERFINSLSSFENVLHCKVTVKGTVNVGIGSVEISVEVSGPCSEIMESGTEIGHMVLQAVKDAILN